MKKLLNLCIKYYRTTLSFFAFFIVAGYSSYINMPKEESPDVKIPIAFISVMQRGISPEDSENLLIKPLEKKIQNIEGVKNFQSIAFEGGCNITVEFIAGSDVTKSINDVKDGMIDTKKDLPKDADEPIVTEINPSLMPVLSIHLLGDLPQRSLFSMAEKLANTIESNVKEVLKVEISGTQKEEIQIIIDPVILESYKIPIKQAALNIINNNQLIAAGETCDKFGKTAIKIPGIINNINDFFNIPFLSDGDKIVKIKDIAKVKRAYRKPSSISRFNGKKVVTLNVIKRTGKNILNSIGKTQYVVKEFKKLAPKNLKISYSNNRAKHIKKSLTNLLNNLISAVILVMLIIFIAIGWRSSLLVSIAIPSSFLCGIFVLNLLGCTINIVVLFALILAVGMLVDGEIIVVEDADRHMANNIDAKQAFINAGTRMFIPVLTSIATTLVVFIPLLFWPGVTGKFMQFLPITLLSTLGSSLLVATLLIPIIGSFVGGKRKGPKALKAQENITSIDSGNFKNITGFTAKYIDLLAKALRHPIKVIVGSFLLLFSIILVYYQFGKGVEFFVKVDPKIIPLRIKSKDSLSVYNKDEIAIEILNKIKNIKGIESISTNVYNSSNKEIGTIIVNLKDWKNRTISFSEISKQITNNLQNVPGVIIEQEIINPCPPRKKPIVINIINQGNNIEKITKYITSKMQADIELKDVDNSLSIISIDWIYEINREQAAKFGLNITEIGNSIKLATNGIVFDQYAANDSKEKLDVVIKFDTKHSNIDQIDNMKLFIKNNKHLGFVPLSSFVKKTYRNKNSSIKRFDGKRIVEISTDVKPGIIVNEKVKKLKHWIKNDLKLKDVKIEFKGEDEDKNEASNFGKKAFLISLVLIAIILITQFNSIFDMILVLTSVFMSVAGLLLGLLITNQSFSIVMCGIIGMVALSGIIVSNNILMIDTYNRYKGQFKDLHTLLIITGAQRLRAILLTQLTTTLGLLPIVFSLTIDFTTLSISYNDPSNQWWRPLATCIVFGVLFASPMTLFFTPCALLLKEKTAIFMRRKIFMKHE